MHTSTSRLGFVSALVVLVCGVPMASGAFLPVGGTLYPAPLELDPLPGLVLFTTGPLPFVGGAFSGTLESVVIAGDPTNPWGGLTFAYMVSNNAGSTNDIGRLTVIDYTGWQTDASYQAPGTSMPPLLLGGAVPPAYINRSTPDVVGFSFAGFPLGPGVLRPGMSSTWLVVQTDAPRWVHTTAYVIDGSIASVPSVGPIPEPAALALLGLGTAFVLRRRRHA